MFGFGGHLKILVKGVRMIKKINIQIVNYVLSEIQTETSQTSGCFPLGSFSIKNKTLFNLSGSGRTPESSSSIKIGELNNVK